MQFPLHPYETMLSVEKIGGTPLHIQVLRDLDKTLDEICALHNPTTPEEQERLLALCPYFGIVWPAARGLGQWLQSRKSLLSGKSGIELGCGLAIPSLIAVKLGAQVLTTDFHPDVKDWVAINAKLNHLSLPYLEWNWDQWNSPDFPKDWIQGFDFVLASDVLYEKIHPESLARACHRLVRPNGRILVADPGRSYLKSALAEFEALGWSCNVYQESVEASASRPELRLEQKVNVSVFEFYSKNPTIVA